MNTWIRVKELALDLVQHDFPCVTMADLDQWIVPAGYPGANNPHCVTRDLVFVYAASLRNAGGPGLTWNKFASLVTEAIDKNWISNGNLMPFSVAQLANACYLIVRQDQCALVRGNGEHYEQGLHRMANGEHIGPESLQSLLDSVTQFCTLLVNQYRGSAAAYHQSFLDPAQSVAKLMAAKWAQITHLPRVGPAVGMNFFKDSQGSALGTVRISDWPKSQLAWFVKADMHVSRLMLCATGRAAAEGISIEELTYLPISDVFRLYDKHPVGNGHAANLRLQEAFGVQRTEWRVVSEVHHWAMQDQVSGLEIDRILYLIGSGRYGTLRLSTSQANRYARFCGLHKSAGGCSSVNSPMEIASSARRSSEPPVPMSTSEKSDDTEPMDDADTLDPASVAGTVGQARSEFLRSFSHEPAVTAFVLRLLDEDVESHWELHHTKSHGGDFRIRVAFPGKTDLRFQNVFTMYWQRKLRVFNCSIYEFDERFLRQYGFIKMYKANRTDPLRHQFKIDVPLDPVEIEAAADQLLELIGTVLENTVFSVLNV
jgi:hypothetical protein